jgi:hypothetical protein
MCHMHIQAQGNIFVNNIILQLIDIRNTTLISQFIILISVVVFRCSRSQYNLFVMIHWSLGLFITDEYQINLNHYDLQHMLESL